MHRVDELYNENNKFTRGEDLMPTVLFNKDTSPSISHFIKHSNDFL